MGYFDQFQPYSGENVASTMPLNPPTPYSTQIPSTTPTGEPDYKAQFLAIMGGLPATPENLASKETELNAIGLKVHRNAAGVPGKVTLPNGYNVDVIANAGSGGGGNWQWLGPPPGWTPGSHTVQGALGAGSMLGPTAGVLLNPNATPEDITKQLPGYKFAYDQALQGAERSAASHGNLLTGGFQKALGSYLGNAIAGPAFQNQLANLRGLTGLGENAAALTGNFGADFGNSAGNLLTGIGNANAAGSVAQGNAWGNAVNNLGNIAATSYLYGHQPQQQPIPYAAVPGTNALYPGPSL